MVRSLARDLRSYVTSSKVNVLLQSNVSESCATADVEAAIENKVV